MFRKGQFFAEHNKEYDAVYNLVAPISMAPRVLLLNLKDASSSGVSKDLSKTQTQAANSSSF